MIQDALVESDSESGPPVASVPQILSELQSMTMFATKSWSLARLTKHTQKSRHIPFGKGHCFFVQAIKNRKVVLRQTNFSPRSDSAGSPDEAESDHS